jgi:hypothetical protein
VASYTEIEFLRTINQTFYDQVKTADQKAGYICTFLTILFAYSKEKGHVLLFLSTPPTFSAPWIFSVLFAVTALFAIACTALVIMPRSKAGGSALYWGAWSTPEPSQKLTGSLSDEFIMAEYLSNIRNLAAICQIKFAYVGLAFRGAAAAIVCYIFLALLIG